MEGYRIDYLVSRDLLFQVLCACSLASEQKKDLTVFTHRKITPGESVVKVNIY